MDYPQGYEALFGCKSKPRAGIVSRNSNLWLCPHLSGKDVVVAIAKFGNVEVYVASVYMDIGEKEPPRELRRLLEQQDRPVLIGMDSNAHSTLCNCEVTDVRGEQLEVSFLITIYLS